MTRFADYVDSAGVRAAAEQRYQRLAPLARDGARNAAAVLAPYATTARDSAVIYAGEARQRLAPKVTSAMEHARDAARDAMPDRLEHAVDNATKHTCSAVRQATDYTMPRVVLAAAAARQMAGPVRREAVARGATAVAALRGQVTVAEIERLSRRRAQRARRGRCAKRVAMVGVMGIAGVAMWKWWSHQTNPDWLVEATEPTEVSERHSADSGGLSSVDGSGSMTDPEVNGAQHQSNGAGRSKKAGRSGRHRHDDHSA